MPTDTPMQLGMIGLGRMGANLVRRLMRDGHRCVAYDRNPDVVKSLAAEGATGAESLADFVAKLDTPRAIWIMVPAGIVEKTLDEPAESTGKTCSPNGGLRVHSLSMTLPGASPGVTKDGTSST